MWAIIGLGNPGIGYKLNRHNIGFCVIDLLAKINNVKFKKDNVIPSLIGKSKIGQEDVLLLKSNTYMNRTGIAVKALCDINGLSFHNLFVIVDDLDLPWGKIRIRKSGSSAGHRGMESIIKELGTTNFPRLRMGIGRPVGVGNEIINHVLGNFNKQERKELENYCKKAVDAIQSVLNDGIESAMNKFN